ncbi:alpha/beta hydrolase [Aspergillus saccharolyticus JOP 1030-1]|uniref:FSH1-domain-containing protein n=1 Tax=Aspergillus saccharolyticus JOP 1030-1 TaxID=1450539 RepID=A0A318ZF26_9EURO|nr:FSH1-domain-containing protein [Aspergillus saccharolyticus JOP 1030-1]PYH44904.1 FSH1-domain-containing protein [Aspergillus saccharolyticus JOP 1030-1]
MPPPLSLSGCDSATPQPDRITFPLIFALKSSTRTSILIPPSPRNRVSLSISYQDANSDLPTKMPAPGTPLKLLCLHGYTQSGPLFHAKTRAVIKHLTKALSPTYTVTTTYPTGPHRLLPSDIPGYEPPTTQGGISTQDAAAAAAAQDNDDPEAYGWFRRSNTAHPPLYAGLEEGLTTLAQVIRDEGPFDAVIGFSQGAAMAAMVAALLEMGRVKEVCPQYEDAEVACRGTEFSGVPGFKVPEAFRAQTLELGGNQGPLKFAVCYSGFRAPGPRYRAFYEPGIKTPVLHVLGSLDAVVDEGRSRALIEACAGEPEAEGRVVFHPGGHFVPSQRPYLDAVVRFIKEVLAEAEEAEGGSKKKGVMDEDVNDMELPF